MTSLDASLSFIMAGECWALDGSAFVSLAEIARDWHRIQLEARVPVAARSLTQPPASGVGIVPVHGILLHRTSLLGTATALVSTQVRQLAQDPRVGSIVLDIDTGGGSVSGITEAHAAIMAARKQKKVVAVANAAALSAGYWLASAASEIVVTPSGMVGSVGVLAIHQDMSAHFERRGVKHSLISAGKHKLDGHELLPLGEDARSHIQDIVDATYRTFVKDVAKGRGIGMGDVLNEFGQGQVVLAKEAVARGMADRVASMDAVLDGLGVEVVPSRVATRMNGSASAHGSLSQVMSRAMNEAQA